MLAKGRASLAAKASAPAVKGEPPASSSSGQRVEVVKLSKASGPRAKASSTTRTKASSSRRQPRPGAAAAPPVEPAKDSGGRGLVDRAIAWLSST